jgi:hypothetical protein
MRSLLIAGLSLFAAGIAFAETAPPPPPKTQATPNPSTTLSKDFWAGWKETKESEEYTALAKSIGGAESAAAAIEEGKKAKSQAIANVALTKPEETAKFLTGVSAAKSENAETVGALATVVQMRTNEAARASAAPLVEPQAAARVEEWRADLSTGIPGLPGIYLGANAEANRPAVPTGYTAVSGGSVGCPSR